MSVLILIYSLLGLLTINVEDINVEDEFIHNNLLFSYGNIVNSDSDGVLIVTDIETDNEVFNIVYDDGHSEYFKYLAVIDENEYVIVCEKYSNVSGYTMPSFVETILIRIDDEGNIVDTVSINTNYKSYYNHAFTLILQEVDNSLLYLDSEFNDVGMIDIDGEYIKEFNLQHRGEALVNDEYNEEIKLIEPGNYTITINENNYSFIYHIVVIPEIYLIGEKYNDYFVSSVKIVSSSPVYVNDEIYVVGSHYEEPGIYDIKIFGENEYIYNDSFIILPKISYVLDGSRNDFVNNLIVYEPITIVSNAISMYLNDGIYNSERIEEVGEYELLIYGVNQMQYRLTFYIHPKVDRLENNEDYENQVMFYIFGDALLNGELVTGEVNVDEPGDYVLELMYNGQVFEKYYFSVLTEDMPVETTSSFNFNYIFGGVILIGVILFFRKK